MIPITILAKAKAVLLAVALFLAPLIPYLCGKR